MSRDYAKKSKPAKGRSDKGQAPRFHWRWLIPIALLSSFVGLLIYLHTVPPINPPLRQLEHRPAEQGTDHPSKQPAKTADGQQMHFQFYKMLPRSKVQPPEIKAYNPGKALDDDNYNYFIQTGSFRHSGDAERQKARIAFQGLRAEIKRVTNDTHNTWYRVQIGPYRSRSKMNSAIDKLVDINISPMVRRVPVKN